MDITNQKVYCYIRVSTHKQDLDLQRDEVIKHCKYRNFEIIRVFEDIASGKSTDRKGFLELVEALESNPHGVNSIVIWKLDRIGRSIRDLINISDYLQKKNVGLVAITSNVDTTTKEGRLFYYMMSAFAEYERELVKERTQLGIDAAKAAGKVCHRPVKNININQVNLMRGQGIPITRIAKNLGVSRALVYDRLKADKGTGLI